MKTISFHEYLDLSGLLLEKRDRVEREEQEGNPFDLGLCLCASVLQHATMNDKRGTYQAGATAQLAMRCILRARIT